MRVRSVLDRLLLVLFIISLMFLATIVGAFYAWQKWWPFEPTVREAFTGLVVAYREYNKPSLPYEGDTWHEIPEGPTGVLRSDPSQMSPGYTLMTYAQQAVLVDADGNIVHRWSLPYAKIHGGSYPVGPPPDDSYIYWRPAQVFPNGDIIVLVSAKKTPSGLCLMKLDSQSRLIWVLDMPVHHDFTVAEDGTIYVLDQQIRRDPPCRLRYLETPFLDEAIVTVSPEGEILDRLSLWDAFCNSDTYQKMLNSLVMREFQDFSGDYLHSNNVNIVSPEFAAQNPFLKPGQIIVSCREIDLLAAVDLETRQVTWGLRGSWRRQHDPDLLPNGNIMLFDNQGDFARQGSRVIEIDPASEEIVWRFPSDDQETLYSINRSEQQPLNNGNVLIREHTKFRVLEVNRDGEVVWEFFSPFVSEDGRRQAAILYIRRYAPEELDFEFNDGQITMESTP